MQTKPRPKVSEQPISTRTEDRAEIVDPKVINLSNRSLNEAEINLLSKGLKFTPTPNKSNPQDLTTDIKEYTRKLRLAEYFHSDDDEENITETSLVKNKSNFNPKKGRNALLDTVCDTHESLSTEDNTPKNKRQHNLLKSEENTIKSLLNDDSIVIKEADKGGAVVGMDAEYYKNKILEMLNNNEFYCEIAENNDKKKPFKK